MMQIFVGYKSERRGFTHLAGPFEIGRAPQRPDGPARCVIGEDLNVSRDHVRLEEIGHGKVRIDNLSRSQPVEFYSKQGAHGVVAPQSTREVVCLQMVLNVGKTSIDVDVLPVDDDEPAGSKTTGDLIEPPAEFRVATSAHSPFLDAIRDAPNDDAPRLIYADWLEERGDPRAQFLRAECALAGVAPENQRYSELQAELRHQSLRVDLEWAAKVSRVPISLEPDFLGFVAQGWGHCSICWHNERLLYFRDYGVICAAGERLSFYSPDQLPDHEYRPSAADWQAFWSVLDANRCWEWVNDDYGRHIECGTPWHLNIRFCRKRIECRGNGFGGGRRRDRHWTPDSAPPRFAQFFQALRRLFNLETL